MKLTPERYRELRKQGIKVDPAKVVRDVAEELPVEKPVELPKPDDTLLYLAQAAKIAEQNTANVLELQFKQAEIIAELAKPKPKKKFVSTVTRDVRGNIKQVETQEL